MVLSRFEKQKVSSECKVRGKGVTDSSKLVTLRHKLLFVDRLRCLNERVDEYLFLVVLSLWQT